jgi:nucleoside phosphorylase
MTDALLERLTYEPVGSYLEKPLPFTPGLEPKLVEYSASPEQALKKVDVLVVTWTSAEWSALADVLSPGRQKKEWTNYTRNWSQFEPHLTSRSPAKEAKCLGEYTYITIGDKKVALAHSQLHLCEDDETAPVINLWQQWISEAQPELIITTGTAGAIGAEACLGDVFIVNSLKLNCTKTFKDKPWAQERFVSVGSVPSYDAATVASLVALNVDKLKPVAFRTPVVSTGGDVETVDYFAFSDTDDSYGVAKNDPNARSEEMDDGVLPVALSLMSPPNTTPWLSIRNASDEQISSSIGTLEQQAKVASAEYLKYGYWTTVNSAIATWAVIAALA